MSGHNPPHGRLGQPNSTWNPLQVPSYVPRQPQLAHMSSERSMARSPLTWPTPPTTHQDKVYNLMTGNLMNNLEMNPLLQGYGRNVGMPLGSVDLSLSSASRSTPSPKGVHNNIQTAATSAHSSHTSSSSTTLPSNIPTSGIHSMAGTDSGLSGSNHQPRTSVPSSGGVIQSTTVAALKERMQGTGGGMPSSGVGSTSSSFGMTNAINDGSNSTMGANIVRGGNGFGAGLSNRTANDLAALVSGGLFVKDAKQINSEMESKNGRDCFSHLSCTDSADLVKEFVLQTMHCNALSVSPKRTSPARASAQSGLSPSRSRSPPLNLLLGPSAIDGKLDCLNSAFPLPSNSAASVPLSLSSESTAPAASMDATDVATVTARALGSLLAGTAASELGTGASTPCPINPSASPTGNSMASSEDSVDSSNSRSNNARRRRKPEKTNKMNAAFPLEDGKPLFPVAKPADGGIIGMDELDSLRSNHTARNDITALAIEGINALSHSLSGTRCDLSQSQPPLVVGPDSNASGHSTPHDIFLPLHAQRKPLTDMTPQDQQQKLLLETLIQSNMNNNGTGAVGTGLQTPSAAASATASGAASGETGPIGMDELHQQGATDCETIEKIAAMVSSTNALATKLLLDKVTESTTDNGIMSCNGPVGGQPATNVHEHDENNGHKGAKKANASDSSYEEVENKLEEMFAGIEEQPGNGVESNVQKVSPKAGESRGPNAATVAPIDHGQTTSLSDGDVMKQLSNDLLAAQCETTNHPVGGNAARTSNGSGKKPLTPAQKRSIGSKTAAQSGESIITSTPAPAKRKRGPKKKSNAHGKPPSFMEPEGHALLGLKALSNKTKGKAGKAGCTGKKGSKGAKGKGSKRLDRESSAGASWAAGGGAAAATSIEPNGKYKYGPYVQVKADGCHTVINAPLNEEDSDKTQHKTKKFGNSLSSSERSKIRGLHVSTLSTKYDADTTDTSWMCVFCKTGPHQFRLGDLFGPYIISTASSEYEQSQLDVDYFSLRRTRDDLESNQAKQKRTAEKLKEQQQSGVSNFISFHIYTVCLFALGYRKKIL
uniref:PHD-type domain-containing protein n=1 Tax=Anopheles maculatus TaxID=74869 RepID=A0A182SPD2_9DIPT